MVGAPLAAPSWSHRMGHAILCLVIFASWGCQDINNESCVVLPCSCCFFPFGVAKDGLINMGLINPIDFEIKMPYEIVEVESNTAMRSEEWWMILKMSETDIKKFVSVPIPRKDIQKSIKWEQNFPNQILPDGHRWMSKLDGSMQYSYAVDEYPCGPHEVIIVDHLNGLVYISFQTGW